MAGIFGVANEVAAEIDAWAQRADGKDRRLAYRQDRLLRLTRLRVWSIRYRVPIGEILDLVMPILRARIHRQNAKYGLGVSIPALTGNGAEEILRKELHKRYPDGEQYKIWKEQTQEHQLAVEEKDEADGLTLRSSGVKSVGEAASISHYLDSYRQRVLGRRKQLRKALDSKWRSRKAYRGNPWC